MIHMQYPLEGIRVVELGTHVAVPTISRMMADWGAEVIKVENIKGDEWRVNGKAYKLPIVDEENTLFTIQNSNKQFISLDAKSEEGHAILMELIGSADVFMSNVRLKSLIKLGCDYDSLKEKFPRLIFAHLNGYGYKGAGAALPGYDMAALWARTGILADWGNPGDFPIKPPAGFGDAAVSSLLLNGILAALLARAKTGEGCRVTTSLYAAGLWLNHTGVTSTQKEYGNIYPKSRYCPMNPFSHLYECRDHEWLVLTVVDYRKNYAKVMRVLGLEQYAEDERYNTIDEVQKRIREFMTMINEAFMQHDRAEWVEKFAQADIVCCELKHMREATEDPQALENGYFEEVTFPNGHQVLMPTIGVEFSAYDVKRYTPSGVIGRDTEQVLQQKGYSEQQIEELREKGVIRG